MIVRSIYLINKLINNKIFQQSVENLFFITLHNISLNSKITHDIVVNIKFYTYCVNVE